MSKVFLLFINENIKALKRKSTIIILILSILSIFGAVGITKLFEFTQNYESDNYSYDWKEELNQRINNVENEIKMNSSYSETSIANMKAEIEGMKFAIENDIDYLNKTNYWKSSVVEKIIQLKTDMYLNNEETSEEVNKLTDIVKQNDFNKYNDEQLKELKEKFDAKEITEEEYNNEKEIIEITKKYDIGKNLDEQDWKQEILQDLLRIKRAKVTKIDQSTGKMLDYKGVQELEESEKIDLYRLEKNIPASISSNTSEVNDYRSFYNNISGQFATFFVALLVIILAGSSISGEISKGTIKFLIMTPNKRWKILLSKILSIICIMLVTTILLSVISYLIGGIFFKGNSNPYLYVSNGEVKVLEAIPYQILSYLSYDIDIVVYAIFAIMLSVLSRNSAFAIGISIAMYAGAGTIMSIINMLVKADWIKFIPFNNMGLTDKIFKNTMMYSDIQMTSEFLNNVSVTFSLCVLGVCCILMLVTMFDSFNKRDIT